MSIVRLIGSLAVLATALSLPTRAFAIDLTAPPMVVKAGSTARLYGVFDCEHNIAPYTTARVDHGKISSRVETINRCGNKNQPITVLYYTPNAGFRGEDEAKIYRGSDYTMRRITVR